MKMKSLSDLPFDERMALKREAYRNAEAPFFLAGKVMLGLAGAVLYTVFCYLLFI